jgi:hypothetical protein
MRDIEEIENWVWNKVNKREITALATYIQQLEQKVEDLVEILNSCDKALDMALKDLDEQTNQHTSHINVMSDDDCIGE